MPAPLPAPAALSDVLILPGWLDSGPGHWQMRWVDRHGDRRVEQHDWARPLRGDWMARLEEVIASSPGTVRLAAHSLGCHLVAAWAAHSRHTARVRGALLVAPPDLDRPDLPPVLTAWRPVTRRPLPFPAALVVSDDDPYAAIQASLALARDWAGHECHRVPHGGHLNAESGLGDWPEARAWLDAIAAPAPPSPSTPRAT